MTFASLALGVRKDSWSKGGRVSQKRLNSLRGASNTPQCRYHGVRVNNAGTVYEEAQGQRGGKKTRVVRSVTGGGTTIQLQLHENQDGVWEMA